MSSKRPTRKEQITIACVTLDPTPVWYVLDQQYKGLFLNGVRGSYRYGLIGNNYIVVTTPSDTSTIPASRSANDLKRDFPHIELTVAVGIAGGIPDIENKSVKENDIRLGDVVISRPSDRYGGVIKYDRGKHQTDGFHLTGTLNKPHDLLLSTARLLEEDDNKKADSRDKIRQYLERINQKSQGSHKYPEGIEDLLFQAEYDHFGPAKNGCVECKKAERIIRPLRDNSDPKIHYGTIASGDSVIKEPNMRKKIGRHPEIKCVEMEAAGLMDTLHPLVIRGISDYADTHKDDKWRSYAAATAAAYMALLLSALSQQPVKKIEADDEERCRKSLHAKKPLSDHSYENMFMNRGNVVNNTCEWIEQVDEYKEWIGSNNKMLWICGSPGKGKTFLAIYLAKLLKNRPQASGDVPGTLVLTFFCSYTNRERSRSVFVVRSLLAQLLQAEPSLYELLLERFKYQEAGKDNLFSDNNQQIMWDLFVEMLRIVQRPVYLVLDGLDECDDDSIKFLLTMLEHLYLKVSTGEGQSAKTVLVSRQLQKSIEFASKIDLDNHHEEIHEALKLFTRSRIRDLQWLDQTRQGDLAQILVSHANGRYLWLALAIQMLKKDDDDGGKLVKCILDDPKSVETYLPQGLDPIYERMLARIPQGSRRIIRKILICVCFAYRPLMVSEIATFVGESNDEIEKQLWRGLFDLDTNTKVCRLVHLSLKEHLVSLGQSVASKSPSVRTVFLYTIRAIDAIRIMTTKTTVAIQVSQIFAAFNRSLSAFFQGKKAFLESTFFGILEKDGHQYMLQQMLRLMNEFFDQKPCEPRFPRPLTEEQKEELTRRQYCCRYWIDHLRESNALLHDNDILHQFLNSHLLHWLEALGWMGIVSYGIEAIISLESLACVSLKFRSSARLTHP
jgi:nucleoside phosphorylase